LDWEGLSPWTEELPLVEDQEAFDRMTKASGRDAEDAAAGGLSSCAEPSVAEVAGYGNRIPLSGLYNRAITSGWATMQE
jgi:hypothetical protein